MKNNLFGLVLICEYIQIACIFIEIYKGKVTGSVRKQFWVSSVTTSILNIMWVSDGYYTGKFRVIAIAAVLLYVIFSGLLIRQRRGEEEKESQDDCEAELETAQLRKAILIMLIWLAVAMLILLDPFEFLREL